MKPDRAKSRKWVCGWFLAIPLVATGCAEEWGPDWVPGAEVSGRIHRSGEPLTKGWLEFLPVDGTIGQLRSVPINPDGTFLTNGVAPGSVAIRVVGADLSSSEYSLFSQIYVIRRKVRDAQANKLDIDLEQERQRVASELSG